VRGSRFRRVGLVLSSDVNVDLPIIAKLNSGEEGRAWRIGVLHREPHNLRVTPVAAEVVRAFCLPNQLIIV
jgi:hypothetical protein